MDWRGWHSVERCYCATCICLSSCLARSILQKKTIVYNLWVYSSKHSVVPLVCHWFLSLPETASLLFKSTVLVSMRFFTLLQFVTFTVGLGFGAGFYSSQIKLSHFSGDYFYPLIISSFPPVIYICCRVRICHQTEINGMSLQLSDHFSRQSSVFHSCSPRSAIFSVLCSRFLTKQFTKGHSSVTVCLVVLRNERSAKWFIFVSGGHNWNRRTGETLVL